MPQNLAQNGKMLKFSSELRTLFKFLSSLSSKKIMGTTEQN